MMKNKFRMMKNKLEEIINAVEPFLSKNGFTRKGKSPDFIRKRKEDFGREELLSFNGRQHRNDPNAIYISCIIGIYYTSVRKIYKCISDDNAYKHPIKSGSISHFSSKDEFMSICYKEKMNKEEVVKYIIGELEEGAFNLLNTYPNLESIYKGIQNQSPIFIDYYAPYVSISNQIKLAIIILLLKGTEASVEWINKNIKNTMEKDEIARKIREYNLSSKK